MLGMLDLQPFALRPQQRLVVGHLAHDTRDRLAEALAEFLVRRLGILDRVVQNRRGEELRVGDPHLVGQHVREGDRMVDVRRGLRVLAPLAAVLVRGEGEGVDDEAGAAGVHIGYMGSGGDFSTRRALRPRASRKRGPGAFGCASGQCAACECLPPGSDTREIMRPAVVGVSLRARSPSEMTPTNRLSRLTTSNRRTFMSLMLRDTWASSSSSKQYSTSPLMISRTLVSGDLPAATARTAMSRSVITPI